MRECVCVCVREWHTSFGLGHMVEFCSVSPKSLETSLPLPEEALRLADCLPITHPVLGIV